MDKVSVSGDWGKPVLQKTVGLFQVMPRRKRFFPKEEKERVSCSVF